MKRIIIYLPWMYVVHRVAYMIVEARYQLNVSIMMAGEGTTMLSYAIIPPDQLYAPRPRLICMISNLTTDQFGRQWP